MNQRTPLLALAAILAFLQSANAAGKNCVGGPTVCPPSSEYPKGPLLGGKKFDNKTSGEEQIADGSRSPESAQIDTTVKIVAAKVGGEGEETKSSHPRSTEDGKDISTGDMGPTALITEKIQAGVQSFKGPDHTIAQSVAAALSAHVKNKYPEKAPVDYGETFVPLLRNELDEKAAIWKLKRQVPRLSRPELEAAIRLVESKSNESLGPVGRKEVASIIETKFTEAWNVARGQHGDREEWGHGGPNRQRLDEMLRNGPRFPSNWSLDAQDKLASGDKAGGRASLDRAISLGGTPEAFALRGALRLEGNDYDGAYQDAKKALELNPGDKNAMGILKSAEGRTSPGLSSSLAAGRPGSGGPGSSGAGASGAAYENRGAGGFAGFDPGKTRDISGMTTASTIASNQKLDEARRALALGDSQAAIALAQRALELNPSNAAAHGFLSSVYARTGDYKRAIASANAGLALAPRDAALLNNKAFAENRSKLYRDALGTSNGAIEADARNPYSYANRAYAYGGLGDKSSMMSDINRAAGIDPRFEKAAAEAAELQLPSNADILFMFPGENPEAPAAAAPARSKSFGLVVGAGVLGGLLVALGLLSTVLAPIKDSVVSAFTKVTRHGPSVHALEEEATPETLPEPAAAGVIRGQYEIVRQIGAGGMGMVYEGTDRSLGRRVAIKKMRDELRINPRERERFVIEAKTVASLHHANIVDIYAIAEEGEDVYLVFEYVDGKTIHDLVQAKGRLNASDSLRVTQAMGDALTYAHAHGVIHRDMKPSNVMLTSDGQIKVMDFGIARMAKDALTRYSMTNTVVGTPPYMAPEQEQGIVRKESDVYSLAICAYEMLTGKLPFIGIGAGMLMNKINMSYIPPSRAIAGLPESLDEVFLKAFQADPDQRYHAPQEFAAALDAALGGIRGRV